MTVKELINELLELEMEAEVSIKIEFANLETERTEFKIEQTRTTFRQSYVELIVDCEPLEISEGNGE